MDIPNKIGPPGVKDSYSGIAPAKDRSKEIIFIP